MKRLTQVEFLRRAKELYGDRYSYEEVVFCGAEKKVVITCPHHGGFFDNATQLFKWALLPGV